MVKKIMTGAVFLLLLLLVSCSSKITWEDSVVNDIKVLEENGFEPSEYNTLTNLDELNEQANREIKQEGYNFEVNFVKIANFFEAGNVSNYVFFYQFETEEQTNNYYVFLSRPNRLYKIFKSNTIIIYATSEKAIQLLDYKFE